MSRSKSHYVCQLCGTSHPKWVGRCDGCGEWNSLVEEELQSAPGGLQKAKAGRGRTIEFQSLEGASEPLPRRRSGIAEFDRVAGGGLVPGSAVLVGGDPGIGKSTLLLQAVAALSAGADKVPCLYISGEEAIDQVRLRAHRLGLEKSPVGLASATSVRDIAASLEEVDAPGVVVIDSIQTMYVDNLDSAPGTVAQVRASAQTLIKLAKERGFSLILVGHVTKEGVIAGPKVLEHMVDAVLTFEGERGHQFRILRATKNRFGATDEIGVFEMTDRGLEEVSNPSALFLADRQGQISGAAVFAGMEGTRPVLVEVQALVSASPMATPRRAVVGWDSARLSMVLAVLEARCGLMLGGKEVYLNVAGGLKVGEPACDLAVAAALISAASDQPVPEDSVVFGEIGLSGEVRAVGQTEARLKEAEKLGFSGAILPGARNRKAKGESKLQRREIGHLRDLVAMIAGQQRTKRLEEA